MPHFEHPVHANPLETTDDDELELLCELELDDDDEIDDDVDDELDDESLPSSQSLANRDASLVHHEHQYPMFE